MRLSVPSATYRMSSGFSNNLPYVFGFLQHFDVGLQRLRDNGVRRLHRALQQLQLQVHDETDGTYEDRAQAERVAEIMSNAYTARVPFKVDVEMGPSWGEIS